MGSFSATGPKVRRADPVQVYGPDKALMGYLHMDVNRILGSRHTLRYVNQADDFEMAHRPGPELAIFLDVRHRSASIDKHDLERERRRIGGGPSVLDDVPAYAESFEQHAVFRMEYRWPTLVCPDAATAEIVFDEQNFEPVGKPCDSSRREDAWWAAREMSKVASGPTLTVTRGTWSAEETEKLKEMANRSLYVPESMLMPAPKPETTSFSWISQAGMGVLKPSSLGLGKITGI